MLISQRELQLRTDDAEDDTNFGVATAKSEMAARLRVAIRHAGGNQAVATKSSVPLGTVNNYVRGVSDPKAATLGAIAQACSVSMDWLVFGQGSTGFSEEDQPFIAAPAPSTAVRGDDFAFLPRYAGAAAAGHGRLAEAEEVSEMVAFRRDWLRRMGISVAHAFLLVADGDSMTPTIPDGALMLVDGSITEPRDIRNGNIYVIVRSGTVIVKRVQFRLDDSVVLISDNALYERETVSREAMNDLQFAGRVVWVGRSI